MFQFTMRMVIDLIYHLCCLGDINMAAQALFPEPQGFHCHGPTGQIIIFHKLCKTLILSSFQFLLVSGGWTGSVYTDTTEIFDGSAWTNVGRLPWGIINFPIINIDNKILSFGKRIFIGFQQNKSICFRGFGKFQPIL